MASSGMLRRVALVRTDILEERSASLIRVTRISELGTTLAVPSNRLHNVPIWGGYSQILHSSVGFTACSALPRGDVSLADTSSRN
jgi:hypothetical protein